MNRDDELNVRPVGRTDVGSDVEITAVPTDIDETPETAEIRADIEQTRAEMSETIEALQERLSPSHLKEQAQEQFHDVKEQVKEQVREQFYEAKEMVRAATIGRVEDMVQNASDNVNDARYTVMETIRANPIPAALVGIGLSWLFMNRRSTPVRYSGRGGVRGGENYGNRGDYNYNVRYNESRGSYGPQYYEGQRYNPQSFEGQRGFGYSGESQGVVGNTIDRAQQTASNVASSVTGTASNVASSVTGTASNVASSVADTASNVASSVTGTASNVASSVADTAGNLADTAQYQYQRVEDRFEQTLRTNPLAVGAVALALGSAVGLALPQTQRENQLMGETRETLVDRAQEVASETFEKVQRVATEVTSEVKETAKEVTKEQAREQGLTS